MAFTLLHARYAGHMRQCITLAGYTPEINKGCAVQGPTTALSEPYLNDITMFDVNTHTWHTPEVKGARPPVRDSHAAVALGDRMVIYGGDCGKEYLGDVWAYHVGHQKWQAFKVRALHPEAIAYALCTFTASDACQSTAATTGEESALATA